MTKREKARIARLLKSEPSKLDYAIRDMMCLALCIGHSGNTLDEQKTLMTDALKYFLKRVSEL